MGASAAPLVAHVAAFARILNAAQTQELHQWTLSSLERAFAWASAMESLAEKAEKDGDAAVAALDEALAQHLRHAALPTMARGELISVSRILRNATRFVCDAVLTSAWLSTHPARAALTAQVLKTRIHSPSVHTEAGDDQPTSAFSELVMARIRTRRSLQAAHEMSDAMVRGVKRKRVIVRSAVFDVAPLASYTLQRRTLRLQSLARTLQSNVCAAYSLESSAYEDLLTRIDAQLQQGHRDVVEVVVWSGVLDWPTPSDAVVRRDVFRRLNQWTESQSMKTLLTLLAPWLAALLASASSAFARCYVAGLFATGLYTIDPEELRSRIGALVLQDADGLRTLVDAQLDALDPLVREQLLTTLAL